MHTAEHDLRQAIGSGGWVDLSAKDEADNDPTAGGTWGPGRQIPAEVIVRLVTGRDPVGTKPRMLRVRGARITGDLDLEAAMIQCPLILEDCHLGTVNLEQAEAPGLYFTSSDHAHLKLPRPAP